MKLFHPYSKKRTTDNTMDWFAIVPTLCIGFAVVRLTAVCQSFLPYVFLPVPGFVVAVVSFSVVIPYTSLHSPSFVSFHFSPFAFPLHSSPFNETSEHHDTCRTMTQEFRAVWAPSAAPLTLRRLLRNWVRVVNCSCDHTYF